MDPNKLIKNMFTATSSITDRVKSLPLFKTNPIISNIRSSLNFSLPTPRLPNNPVALARSKFFNTSSANLPALGDVKSAAVLGVTTNISSRIPMTDVQRKLTNMGGLLNKIPLIGSNFSTANFINSSIPLNLNRLKPSALLGNFLNKSPTEITATVNEELDQSIDQAMSTSNGVIEVENPLSTFPFAEVLGVDLQQFDEEDALVVKCLFSASTTDDTESFRQLASMY